MFPPAKSTPLVCACVVGEPKWIWHQMVTSGDGRENVTASAVYVAKGCRQGQCLKNSDCRLDLGPKLH